MEPDDDTDMVHFDEKCELTWRRMLSQFDNEIWPIFEKHGVSKGEAMILWELNRIFNVLEDIKEKD